MIHIIHLTATKVGGACSHLGSIGPKVGGALALLALWLPRPCMAVGGWTPLIGLLVDAVINI